MTNSLSIPTPKTSTPGMKRRMIQPVIGLERPVKKTLSKDESLVFKLRSNPTDETSTTYELTVPFFKHGTPEELLVFFKDLKNTKSSSGVV